MSLFINRIRKRIDPCSRLYIAFSVNPICDVTNSDSGFDAEFEKMRNELQLNGVHVANLSTNLRNTKDIGELSRNVKVLINVQDSSKMRQHIKPLVTRSLDVSSTKRPLMIPFYRSKRIIHFNHAMKKALENAKESTPNVVIIYHDKEISSEFIKKSLIENGESEDGILKHPVKQTNESVSRLANYLKQPKGVYIVPYDKFIGMEAQSVIYVMSQSLGCLEIDSASKSVRCNISRAVAHLTIIKEMNDEHRVFVKRTQNHILFHSIDIYPDLIECQKTIRFELFKCESCQLGSSSISPSVTITTPLLEEQRQNQGSSNIFFTLFRNEKFVCGSCIQICHNNHQRGSFFRTSYPFSTFYGLFRHYLCNALRDTRCAIAGETKCRCNELTECQLLTNDSDLVPSRMNTNMLLFYIFILFTSIFVPVWNLIGSLIHNSIPGIIWNSICLLWPIYAVIFK